MAVGAYSGRQERPFRGPQEVRPFGSINDDLPDIYIPNELTGNEITEAFRLGGQKQAVVEVNEVKPAFHQYFSTSDNDFYFLVIQLLDYLEFIGTGRERGSSFAQVDLKDGHFAFSEGFLDETRKAMVNELELEKKDDFIEVVTELMEQLRLKAKFTDWDDMSGEANRIYQEIME